MLLQPVELKDEDPPLRCSHCSAQTRCAGQTVNSLGPTYTYCLSCLCSFMVSLP